MNQKSITIALLLFGLLALSLVACTGAASNEGTAPEARQPSSSQITATPLASTPIPLTTADPTLQEGVSGIGIVAAEREADLNFTVTGTIAEVLIQKGDIVTETQVLARLDPRPFEQQLREAEAAFKLAHAQAAVLDEAPKSAAVAAAQAQVRQAEITLAQTRTNQTQDQRTADSQVTAAEASLQSTRDQLSAAKTNAELDLQNAVNALTQAQSVYATAKGNWEYVDETGADPSNPKLIDPATGESAKNRVNNTQRQQYYDAFVQAEAALRTAEEQVTQAQVAYDNARQTEITGIQEAEQGLTQAQANQERGQLPAEVDQVAAAQAGLQQAQAGLQQLYPDPSTAERTQAAASIEQAEASVSAAQLNLEYAQLRAPFNGVIATVNVDAGDPSAVSQGAAIQLLDVSTLHIDLQISDIDIGRVQLGQNVRIVVEGVLTEIYTGNVRYIAPTITSDNSGGSQRTYLVEVSLDDQEGLRPGMSVRAEIMTDTPKD